MLKIVFILFMFRVSCAPQNATDSRELMDKSEKITFLHIVEFFTTDGIATIAETSQQHKNVIAELARLDLIHEEDEKIIYCNFRKSLKPLIFELHDVKINKTKLEAEMEEAATNLMKSLRIYVKSTGINEKEREEKVLDSTLATLPSKLSKLMEELKSLKKIHSELKERIDSLFEAYDSISHKTMKSLLAGLRAADSDITPVKGWKCDADHLNEAT